MNLKRRIILYAAVTIPLILLFVIYKWTHGLVVIEGYVYKRMWFQDNFDDNIGLFAVIESRPDYRKIDEVMPYNIYSRLTQKSAYITLTLIANEPLIDARIDRLIITDDNGRAEPISFQDRNIDLSISHDSIYVPITMHPMEYISVKGPGYIKVSGVFTSAKDNLSHAFESKVHIFAMKFRSIITRKKFNEFNEIDDDEKIILLN